MSSSTDGGGRPGAPLLEDPSQDPTDAGASKAAEAAEGVGLPPVLCGVLTWRPSWLQWAADIRVFTFVLSMMNLFSGLNVIYYTAVITQIEKRFGLTSSVTGFLKNADNIGFFLTVIVVSHFCRHSNKPRLFAIATVVNAIAVFLFAVPHFIYGGGSLPITAESRTNGTTGSSEDQGLYCTPDGAAASAASMEGRCRASGSGLFTYNAVAVAIFTVASVLQGMANSPMVALGITYLDDNAKEDSPKYFGFMFAVRALSPVLAFLLGAWTNSKYVDLSDPGIDQRDPRWVGAWWLGFLICSGLVLVSAFPIVFFPPHMAKGAAVVKEDKSLLANAKDLPYALFRLVKNSLYMVVLLAICFDVYIMGYMTFLPKYIELHFGQTASFASLLTGIIMASAWSTGPIISGRVFGRKMSPFTTMKIVVIISVISISGFIVLMFLGCPHQPWVGPVKQFRVERNLAPICNLNCTCDSRIFSPVCGSDGVNYASACYAGCPGNTVVNSTTALSECSCVAPPTDSTADPGKCDFHCGSTLVAYSVVLFITSFATSMYIIPSFTVIMRCVSYKDKALSIALAVAIMQILVFPAPMVFGLAIDGTCLLHDTSCSAKGACLIYHNTKFRLRLHGLTVILKGVAIIMYSIGLFLSRKVTYSDDEDQEVKVEAKDEEMVALKGPATGTAA